MMDVMRKPGDVPAVPPLAFDDVVSRVPFLRALGPAERERLRPYAQVRAVSEGRPVWMIDDELKEFIFVLDGHVKLCRPCETGREVILDVGAPGELLCSSAVTNFEPACCACVALNGDVMVVAFPRRDVLHVIEQSTTAAGAFVREATGRDVRLGRRIVELASGQVEQRAATLLLRLADQIGETNDARHIQIPLRLSRQDLADLCGTTLETAIRTMTRLAREGVVRTGAKGPIVVDRRRLEALSRGEGGTRRD
jgi:CRP-like cAMP-binding protein